MYLVMNYNPSDSFDGPYLQKIPLGDLFGIYHVGRDWTTLADVWNTTAGWVKWNVRNLTEEDIEKLQSCIKNRISNRVVIFTRE
jgi:hypothetical protein